MPVRSVFDEYAYWLASVPTAGVLITAAEFFWGASNFFFAGNHISVPTLCIYETGANVTLQPYQFEVTKPERSGTTEANISLSGPCTGPLFNLFQSLRGSSSDFTIRLQIRYFLYPAGMGRPLANRPETYYVTSMTFSRTNVTVDAAMTRLPRLRAGIPYTIDEYPGLTFQGG